MKNTGAVMDAMIRYDSGDIKRINHFIKVYGYAKAIGELEELDEYTREILEVAAIVHDIGIKISEAKYNSSSGHYQQIEGPAVAEKMLSALKYDKEFIDRVCYLIAHHHTYNNIDGIDYQILVEADFLVNLHEDNVSSDGIKKVKENIFRTKTGISFLNNCFGVL
jgi:HD superfamily phosphodiesterase